MVAECRQQVGHARVADPPQARHEFGLRVRRHVGEQFRDDVLGVGFLQQAGPQVHQQPGPVLPAQFHVLAVLVQPHGGMGAQHRIGQGLPDGSDRVAADPVQHRESGPPQPW